MTQNVTVQDFSKHAAELLAKLSVDNDVVIQDGGKSIARLAAIAEIPSPVENAPRPLGLFKGKIWMAPDFDAELPEEFWCPPDDPLTK